MKEILHPHIHRSEETVTRTVVKTVIYRFVKLVLDFVTVYIFTGKLNIAFGFMIASTIYNIATYVINERIWDKIKWGKVIYKKTDD